MLQSWNSPPRTFGAAVTHPIPATEEDEDEEAAVVVGDV